MLRGLYAITDSTLLADGRLLPYCRAALEGGARMLQYRDKSGDASRRLDEASALAELCSEYGATLIINDDLTLAERIGAGLHLGQDDGSLATARDLLGAQAVIGATCHADLALAQTALDEGASYVAFGRFFTSATKPDAPAAPLDLLARAKREIPLPIVAIGGVTQANAPSLIRHGADALAVVHALFAASSATEVADRARAFSALFTF